MFVKHEISIYDFVSALSEAMDLVFPAINNHQKEVALIACNIALEMNLTNDEIQDIVLAAMLHDIGAFSLGERLKFLTFEQDEKEMDIHSSLGYKLLRDFEPLANAAVLIKYHHTDYDPLRHEVPIGSYIIHLADRVSPLFVKNRDVLEQIPDVIEEIKRNNFKFHPDAHKAFLRITKLEYVWFEAFLPLSSTMTMKRIRFSKAIVDLETLRNFAQIIARIIDFRSRFTATHSSGVAAVVQELAFLAGFSERECKMAEIAGLLHDLGKLSVPNEILEKNGELEIEEVNIIKKHTYYTFIVLNKVKGMEDIASWAAYHHERQDGNGYPFHLKSSDFCKLARLMAVADVLTALTEDRPYRPGMNKIKVMEILLMLAESGGVDMSIIELVDKNFLRINNVRAKAQYEAQREYEAFYEVPSEYYAENLMTA